MNIRMETRRYSLWEDRIGHFKLVRLSDGAEAYFQGEDADLWRRNMDAIEATHADNEATLNRSFNTLCEGYDEILEEDA
jgi:hypothetical protein